MKGIPSCFKINFDHNGTKKVFNSSITCKNTHLKLGFKKFQKSIFSGFDTFYGSYGGAIKYFNHTKKVKHVEYLDYFQDFEPNWNKTGVYSTFDFGNEAREIFEKIRQPKFIYLSFNAPHGPVSAPEDLVEQMKKIHPTVSGRV